MNNALRRTLLSCLALLCGCEFDLGGPGPTPEPVREVPDVVSVNGVTFDPEYYLLSFLQCGDPDCPPPLLLEGIPHVEGAKVWSAEVSAIEPGAEGLGVSMPAPTGFDGIFTITGIPQPADLRLYLHAYVPDGASPPSEGEPFPKEWHPGMAPLPAYAYLPTTTVKPIFTEARSCFNQRAVMIGDAGALEAVALYLTLIGTPTTVSDLLDSSKTGGVLVWWNQVPGDVVLRVPGFGTMTEVDVGDTYLISWAPPGLGPPFQSQLGLFVDDTNDPANSFGLTVTVLPPTLDAYTEVNVTPFDPVDDPSEGRPWPFLPLDPIRVRPGEVSYGEHQPGIPSVQGRPVPAGVCYAPEMLGPPPGEGPTRGGMLRGRIGTWRPPFSGLQATTTSHRRY
ncbi:MAG: hypothetical protein M3Y59_19645 [Myxococcota bacterium]|nr:hypothetical protein [Myxococcota bacterium]